MGENHVAVSTDGPSIALDKGHAAHGQHGTATHDGHTAFSDAQLLAGDASDACEEGCPDDAQAALGDCAHGDGHDGPCHSCSVCHQTASPVGLVAVALERQAHALPLTLPRHSLALALPPLTKPPIS